MADEDKDQRTEEPTEKKRQDTFKKGRTAQSKEANSTFVLLVTALMIYASGAYIRENLTEIMKTGFTSFVGTELSVATLRPIALYNIKMMALTLAPIMLSAVSAALFINFVQNGGFIFSADPISPKWSKLNPLKGFRRFVSKQAFVELLKSIFKIVIVTAVCYKVLSGEWQNIPRLADQNIEQVLLFISWVGFKLMIYVLLVMVLLAIADYGFQKYSFEESIKMTKQEIKDERKNMEGDPIVKSRIRSAQIQIARRRMMAEVPKAEVVITNPTHLAVALAYDRARMSSPQVVAKGAGFIAEKIKVIAREHDIPILEDKPLARILFKTVNIGDSIPVELYKSIAEILAYVYRLNEKRL